MTKAEKFEIAKQAEGQECAACKDGTPAKVVAFGPNGPVFLCDRHDPSNACRSLILLGYVLADADQARWGTALQVYRVGCPGPS